MRLPNGEAAIVDISELRDYALNAHHPRGRHKARVFARRLGITRDDSDWLRERVLEAAASLPYAQHDEDDAFGRRYTLDFALERDRYSAMLRSGWIIRAGEEVPRLTTLYVLKP